jgi:hypothetical protein
VIPPSSGLCFANSTNLRKLALREARRASSPEADMVSDGAVTGAFGDGSGAGAAAFSVTLDALVALRATCVDGTDDGRPA